MSSGFDDEIDQAHEEAIGDEGGEAPAADEQPADEQPVDEQPADEQPADEQPADNADGGDGGGEEEATVEEGGGESSTAGTGAVLHRADNGVQGADIEVTMADSVESASPTSANDGRTLWTWMMSDCCAIATYNPSNGERTLVHLKGGQAGDSYYRELVGMITDDTDVIMASGTNYASEDGFRTTACSQIQERLNTAFADQGRAFDQSKYQVFWTAESDDKARGMRMGSFGINAQAEYGRVLA